LSPSSWL